MPFRRGPRYAPYTAASFRALNRLPVDRCGLLLQVSSGKRALFFGDGQQGGIELDKGGVHCRMLGVTAVAIGGGWDGRCCLLAAKGEEGPLPRKTRLVLHVELKSRDIRLKVSALIDGTPAMGCTLLKDEYRFVWPGAGIHKGLVRFGIDEDVVEYVLIAHLHRRVIAHVEPRSQVNPLPVTLREFQLAALGEFRATSRCSRFAEDWWREESCGTQQQGYRSAYHAGSIALSFLEGERLLR